MDTVARGGTIATKVDYGTGGAPLSVQIGDLNGDGEPDLATANNNSSTVSVLLGNGNGTFLTKVDYGTGNLPRSLAIGDLDGDCKPDLAVANFGTVSVLLSIGTMVYTPVGTDVTVTNGNTKLTFYNVTTAGSTEVKIENNGPASPAGFTLMPSNPPDYYKITTTAVFSDSIEVCLVYDSIDVVGPESALTLQHYNQTLMAWEEITRSVDEAANRICGRTASLSPFVMAARSVLDAGQPLRAQFRLYSALPNPVLGQTRIRYELPVATTVDLRIYDVTGALVHVLEDGAFHAASRHEVVWNGRGDNGARVVPGVYLYRHTAGGMRRTGSSRCFDSLDVHKAPSTEQGRRGS